MPLRVRFVEPRPAGRNVYDLTLLPRLGLPLLATLLGAAGHDARVWCEVLAPVDLEDCLRADLVGISATTATAPAAYELADVLGQAGVPVVLGGPHVSFMADEALDHAPFVVRGEGETTTVELVGALEAGVDLGGIPGLSYRTADGPRHNPPRRRCDQAQFERLPAPDLRLVHGHERIGVKPLMTQWGCPFDCEFCSVTAADPPLGRSRRTSRLCSTWPCPRTPSGASPSPSGSRPCASTPAGSSPPGEPRRPHGSTSPSSARSAEPRALQAQQGVGS